MMIYINMAEKNFNGSICSLLMFQYEIVNGQGLIAKNQIDKPYWYGSNQIGANIDKINGLITTLQTNCRDNDFKTNLDTAYEDNKNFILNFNTSLESIYSDNKDKYINIDDSNQIKIIPLYILNLGPKEKSSSLTGKIYEEYMNKYNYMFFDIIAPVKMLCDHIGSSTGGRRILDDDESPVGMKTFNSNGEIVTLVSKKRIAEKTYAYNIITGYHINVFANGILTSWRLNNIYEMKNMKFVKDNRELIDISCFADIPKEYFDGLRLSELAKDLYGSYENTIEKINGRISDIINNKK